MAELTDRELNEAIVAASEQGNQEALQVLVQLKEKRSRSNTGSPLFGAAEVAATIGSGIAAEPTAGVAGLAVTSVEGVREGAETVDSVRHAMTYQPKTQTGQRYLRNVGEALEPVAEGFEKAGHMLGERGAELLSPFGEKGKAVGYALGNTLPEGVGLAIGGLPLMSRVAARSAARTTRIDPRVDKINRGDTDTAGQRVNEKGKVRGDAGEREALRQGVDPGIVTTVRVASRGDRTQMLKMVNELEKGQMNRRYAALNPPSKVAGESIAKRYKHVEQVKRRAGRELDDVAKRLKGQPADFDPAVNQFLSGLEDMGVDFNPSTARVSFKGSDVQGIKGLEATINRTLERMYDIGKSGRPDAYAVHQLKRWIDNNVSYTKQAEGLTAQVENLLKELRHNLDETLDGAFPEYDRVNTIYAETKSVMDEFESSVASRIDFRSKNVDRALGIESRKIASNYASGSLQLESLEDLTRIANRYGGQFDDDLVTQVMFFTELNRLFPQAFKNTFQGDIEKAMGNAARGNLKDIAIDKGIEAVKDKALNLNEAGRIRALRNLLKESQPQLPPGTRTRGPSPRP